MPKAYAAKAGSSNSAPERTFRGRGKKFPLNVAIGAVLQAIWPLKRDMRLAAITGATDKTARNWLASQPRTAISGDAIAKLLRTEDGLQVLEAIMGDARPAWWRKVQRASRLANLRVTIAKQEQAIRQMELDFGDEC
jgi:hypothetical protein